MVLMMVLVMLTTRSEVPRVHQQSAITALYVHAEAKNPARHILRVVCRGHLPVHVSCRCVFTLWNFARSTAGPQTGFALNASLISFLDEAW